MQQRTSLPQRGFTVLEFIITLTILTVLAGVLIPSVNNYLEESNRGLALSEMKEIARVFADYRGDTFQWPTPNDKLPIKTGNHAFATYYGFYRNTTNNAGWDGPYLNDGVAVGGKRRVSDHAQGKYEGVLDPWSRQYRVFTYGNGYGGTAGGVMLVSYGYDGRLNTNSSGIFAGDPQGDDIIQLITYTLK